MKRIILVAFVCISAAYAKVDPQDDLMKKKDAVYKKVDEHLAGPALNVDAHTRLHEVLIKYRKHVADERRRSTIRDEWVKAQRDLDKASRDLNDYIDTKARDMKKKDALELIDGVLLKLENA